MYLGEKVLAIIPARGNSKRLPKKNVTNLEGKPLIAWSIEEGLSSKYIDRVVVSTEDQEIASIAKKYGADVPFMRPIDLAGDETTTYAVLEHAIKTLSQAGDNYTYIILLQPTSPLRTREHIDQAFHIMKEKEVDGVISVTPVPHPMEWTNILPEDMSMSNFVSEKYKNVRSQDFPIRYQLNGSIYISKISSLLKYKTFFQEKNITAFVMGNEVSVDIDTHEDLMLASYYLCGRKNNTH